MAKKKSKKELDMENIELDENGDPVESKGSKIISILVAILVIAIWLVIFGLLIKMDVGGVGTMLRPYLKNVPVVNMILPEATVEEIEKETGYKFNSIAEAVERIKQLEDQLANYHNTSDESSKSIDELKAEIERLKVYEQNQLYYEQLKDKFDDEVVYNANAPDIEEYKKWYEELDADNAARIYEEVAERVQYSQKIKDWAETMTKMEAKNAAAILSEMTGDTDLVKSILMSLNSTKRAAILAQMDSVFAAKIVKLMYPG